MVVRKKEVVTSNPFDTTDLIDIFEYGNATFGERLAINFIAEIYTTIGRLETEYDIHLECRHVETKSKMYRNIILGSYLIIYRITKSRVKILRAFHGSR